MRNEKLIPFEIIERAVTGEADAINTILRHYIPHIKYLSKYQEHINDEIQDRLKSKLMNAVLQFPFDH